MFSISNRYVTSGAKKLKLSSSEGTTNPSTSSARTTLELSFGSRKAKTSARSAPGSPATNVASAWSAAFVIGRGAIAVAMAITSPVTRIANFLILKRNMSSSPLLSCNVVQILDCHGKYTAFRGSAVTFRRLSRFPRQPPGEHIYPVTRRFNFPN